MTKYVIALSAHAMDHIPESEMASVAAAAHEVIREAIDAGVYVVAGGLVDQPASIVGTDGTITEGAAPDSVGGFTIVDVPSHSEAMAWAAKIAVACRCAQEVREIGPDPDLESMLMEARSRP